MKLNPRTVLLSPTAFKGTLSPLEVTSLMKVAIKKKWREAKIIEAPLADGGDGTLEVLQDFFKGKICKKKVHGPLGKPVLAPWIFIKTNPHVKVKTALIEMAKASGLALVKGQNKILEATTFGTGELILEAIKKGCKHIIIGVGGTATADGGAGALQALGYQYFNSKKKELEASPEEMIHFSYYDQKHVYPQLKNVQFTIISDVTNPLLGPQGSAKTFGPQKGATPSQVKFLERVMQVWAKQAPRNVARYPGVGAAGGLSFGLKSFLNAKIVQGTPYVMELFQWKEKAKNADIILTGEGQLDKTSFSGKVIGAICENTPKKILVVCGKNRLSKAEYRNKGIFHVIEMGPQGLKNPKESLIKEMKRYFSNDVREFF
ncbi:MAG: glycerate kinase [Elusimicrobiota bacterium]